MNKIPLIDLKAQYLSLKDEIDKVIFDVLDQTSFIGGHFVDEFEELFAKFCDAKYVVGMSNGTEAITLLLRALDINIGNEVILPAHTFVATCEAVRLVGATPIFVDIEETSFNLDPIEVKRKITPKTKAIIPVHLYGRPADASVFEQLAKEYNLKLIFDAAQAHGAKFSGESIAKYGIASTFSFYPGKNLGACGDAGAIVTDDSDLAQKLYKLRDHGRTKKYLHEIIGTNARLDALQAAVLSVKLKYLNGWIAKRNELAKIYCEKLQRFSEYVLIPEISNSQFIHAMHLFVIRVDAKCRDELLQYLHDNGIEAGIHYPVPLHLQPCNKDLNYESGDLLITEKIAKEIISLPMYPELSNLQVDYIVRIIEKFFSLL